MNPELNLERQTKPRRAPTKTELPTRGQLIDLKYLEKVSKQNASRFKSLSGRTAYIPFNRAQKNNEILSDITDFSGHKSINYQALLENPRKYVTIGSRCGWCKEILNDLYTEEQREELKGQFKNFDLVLDYSDTICEPCEEKIDSVASRRKASRREKFHQHSQIDFIDLRQHSGSRKSNWAPYLPDEEAA